LSSPHRSKSNIHKNKDWNIKTPFPVRIRHLASKSNIHKNKDWNIDDNLGGFDVITLSKSNIHKNKDWNMNDLHSIRYDTMSKSNIHKNKDWNQGDKVCKDNHKRRSKSNIHKNKDWNQRVQMVMMVSWSGRRATSTKTRIETWHSHRWPTCQLWSRRATSTKTRIETLVHLFPLTPQLQSKSNIHKNKDWNRIIGLICVLHQSRRATSTKTRIETIYFYPTLDIIL